VAGAAASGLGTELSDAALVGLYRDGAGDFAFAELVRRHQITVFRLLLTLLTDADRAERACEQVFFEAARRIDELTAADTFYTWVAGLARNFAQKLEAEREKTRAPPKPRPAPANARAAVKRHVQDLLKSMSGDERVALVLSELEGNSFDAIAATLGTTVIEAEQLVTRARDKFVGALTASQSPEPQPAPAQPTPGSLAPGTVLGARYRVEGLLGAGGMGAVYRALDTETERYVALKTLLPKAAADATLRRRFQREADLLRRLTHPNFVHFVAYGGGVDEPAYVVMDFVDGTLMSNLLERQSRLPPERALRIARHVLHGLDFAHELGVVHRDIKPANIMLTEHDGDADFAKILDLGIARALSPQDLVRTQLTDKNEIFGTPAYMSPEQVRGEDVDGRSDLYSVTAMLFESLAARPPFEARNATSLLAMHLASEPPALFDVAPDLRVPPELQALLDRGLSKEKSERFASAKEYLQTLDALLAVDWAQAGPPPPRTTTRPVVPRGFGAEPARIPALVAVPRRLGARERLRKIPLSAAIVVITLVCYALWRSYRYLSGQ